MEIATHAPWRPGWRRCCLVPDFDLASGYHELMTMGGESSIQLVRSHHVEVNVDPMMDFPEPWNNLRAGCCPMTPMGWLSV